MTFPFVICLRLFLIAVSSSVLITCFVFFFFKNYSQYSFQDFMAGDGSV